MRTNIDIDDELMAAAMKATGQTTKKATVEAALREVVMIHEQRSAIQEMKGLGWEGDLHEMRANSMRHADWGFAEEER